MATRLELRASKEEILRLYTAHALYGSGKTGAAAINLQVMLFQGSPA